MNIDLLDRLVLFGRTIDRAITIDNAAITPTIMIDAYRVLNRRLDLSIAAVGASIDVDPDTRHPESHLLCST